MAVEMVKAVVHTIRFSDLIVTQIQFNLLTQINISTGMTPKDLVKVCKEAMLKSFLFSPCPSGTLSSDLLVLKGPRDPGSKDPVFLLL